MNGKDDRLRRHERRLVRRSVLRLGGATILAGLPVSACDLLSTSPRDNRRDTEKPRGGAAPEAPMLADRVAAGDLPPVSQRLPKNPAVVEPFDRPGEYGGEWRTILLGQSDAGWITSTAGYEPPVRFDPPSGEIVPNVLESFAANNDATVFTLHLREGLKWSDGEPFTADDLVFAYNDVRGNRKLYPVNPNAPVATKVDTYTVTVSFEEPNGLFLLHPDESLSAVALPAHYLKQFHADYNPGIEDLVKKERAQNWTTLFQAKADRWAWANVDLPTVAAYRPVTPAGGSNRIVVERNPYYWKVDPAGRQLPYIDRIVYEIVNDAEVLLLKATSGEIDMQDRNLTSLQNKPVLAASREDGEYRFFDSDPDRMNLVGIAFNMTHKDPVKREVLASKDFRIGLSHAINRQEIIDVVYRRQGRPWQLSPRPETRFHNERLATQYLEYDEDLANDHLDRAGYSERNADGFRLGPDGERIVLQLSLTTEFGEEWAGVADLLKRYWANVGVATSVDVQGTSLYIERWSANNFQLNIWEGYGGADYDTILDPAWYLPQTAYGAPAPSWAEWYATRGAKGVEPPDLVRQQYELYDQIKQSSDYDKQSMLMNRILDISADLFHSIGICLPARGYGIVKNNFHNVPDPMPAGWFNPGSSHPEQFFMT
jgi:peptide/nickel transport system substrate-binding protein